MKRLSKKIISVGGGGAIVEDQSVFVCVGHR